MAHIDPIFKQTLVDHLSRDGVIVETEVEVGRLPRTIDGIVTVTDERVLPELAVETPFGWFQSHNIIAFKGHNDPLDQFDYYLILSRSYVSLGEQNIDESNATLTIICGSIPRNEMARVRGLGGLIREGDGVYRIGRYPLKQYLIVINELPQDDSRYDIIQMFTSSRKRFYDFMRLVIERENVELAMMSSLAHPDWLEEFVMQNADLMSTPLKPEFVEWFTNDFLPRIPIEKRLDGLSPDQIVSGLSLEERQQLLALLLSGQNKTAH